mmetsp:Transcript_8838/g.18862  ORF Transcript_8838/g.18862 Transcript_8838/m.18862 type:complete len:98 (+) Transcript_8838:317-610(+)
MPTLRHLLEIQRRRVDTPVHDEPNHPLLNYFPSILESECFKLSASSIKANHLFSNLPRFDSFGDDYHNISLTTNNTVLFVSMDEIATEPFGIDTTKK